MSLGLLKKILARVLNWMSFAVLVPAALLVMASLVPIPGGLKIYTVLTGSMEPVVPTGSLIVMRTGVPAADLAAGDIVTFKSPRSDDVLITHRIAGVIGEGEGLRFITRGDANGAADPWEVRQGSIQGRYQRHVPYVGFALEFAKTPVGLLLLVILPTILIAASELRQIVQVLVERKLNQLAAAYGFTHYTALLQSLHLRGRRQAVKGALPEVVSSLSDTAPVQRPGAVWQQGHEGINRYLDSVLPRRLARSIEPLVVVAPVRHRRFMPAVAVLLVWMMVAPVVATLVSNTAVLGGNTVVTATMPLSTVPPECSDIVFDGDPVIGGDNSEAQEGTEGNDLIFGNGGSDKLEGLGGDDCLVGGEGSDSLLGGAGDDVLVGGAGSDKLTGGGGNDKLYGEDGSDSLHGEDGDDQMAGGAGEDSINGGLGTDTCDAESEISCEP